MATAQKAVSARIAQLNDEFRDIVMHGPIVPGGKHAGMAVITAGIQTVFDPHEQAHLFTSVSDFSDFTEDNDPYGEHDFGVVHFMGKKIFWKISYYNRQAWPEEYGSLDPADPAKTFRVITLMFPEEY